jgi:hypothetical protein
LKSLHAMQHANVQHHVRECAISTHRAAAGTWSGCCANTRRVLHAFAGCRINTCAGCVRYGRAACRERLRQRVDLRRVHHVQPQHENLRCIPDSSKRAWRGAHACELSREHGAVHARVFLVRTRVWEHARRWKHRRTEPPAQMQAWQAGPPVDQR